MTDTTCAPRQRGRLAMLAAAACALAACGAAAQSIGDLTGDGNDDVLLRHSNGGWQLNAMDGRRRLADESGSLRLPESWSWQFQGIGDFDGDGIGEVLLRNETGRWYRYDAQRHATPGASAGTRLALRRDRKWELAAVGDFDGDGSDDVLLRHSDTRRWILYPMEDGAVASSRGSVGLTRNPAWNVAGIGDFNGDGRDDILIRNDDSGRWYYYPMNGRRVLSGRGGVGIEAGAEWRLAGIGNFDGSGGDEILLRHASGRWLHYAMDGRRPIDSGSVGLTRDTDYGIASIGDLNGDGSDDVLLRRGNGAWHYYPMDGRRAIAAERGAANIFRDRAWSLAHRASSWQPGVFADDYNARYKNFCAVPRTGEDADGFAFPDQPGTATQENHWLRAWSNDTYLWYDEIEDRNPACCDTPGYFDRLRTFARTPSGKLKDQFHFTENTAQRNARVNTGSAGAGYGASYAVFATRPPRDIRVRYTEPDSPATAQGAALLRGTRILEVDGVDIVYGDDVDTINGGLWPRALGETHTFRVQDPGGDPRTIAMTSAQITSVPVQHARVLDTDTGPVGYLLMNSFSIRSAEGLLVDAFTRFRNADVRDVILDLRYNGGGFVILSNQLTYMLAGSNSQGRIFNALQFNDKHQVFNPITGQRLQPDPFRTTTIGWSTPQAGVPLPSVDLDRVFVLTGPRTCSASELVINALRGIDVDVVQIGETTCGKPYGFYSQDNCGTTYSTVQFRSVNAKSFGDYPDGFSPSNLNSVEGIPVAGCVVADDFDHQFGDPAEARMAAALQYRETGTCPPLPPPAAPIAETDTGPAITVPESEQPRGYMIAIEDLEGAP